MIYKEDNPKSKIVFHGSKNVIDGEISPNYGRRNNDFGNGFYCGESIEQITSFVSKFSTIKVIPEFKKEYNSTISHILLKSYLVSSL